MASQEDEQASRVLTLAGTFVVCIGILGVAAMGVVGALAEAPWSDMNIFEAAHLAIFGKHSNPFPAILTAMGVAFIIAGRIVKW